jgi:hypothetical protein
MFANVSFGMFSFNACHKFTGLVPGTELANDGMNQFHCPF